MASNLVAPNNQSFEGNTNPDRPGWQFMETNQLMKATHPTKDKPSKTASLRSSRGPKHEEAQLLKLAQGLPLTWRPIGVG